MDDNHQPTIGSARAAGLLVGTVPKLSADLRSKMICHGSVVIILALIAGFPYALANMVVWTLFIVAVLTAFVGLGLLAWGAAAYRSRED